MSVHAELDRLLADDSAWEFRPTKGEIARVRDAYVGFQLSHGRVPDFDNLRACIMHGFSGDVTAMLRFWDGKLLSDAPRAWKELDVGLRAQLEDAWRERKIASIVTALGFEPLVAWERHAVSASLLSPAQLRRAADELEQLNADDYTLTLCEVDDEKVVTWHLRREKRTA